MAEKQTWRANYWTNCRHRDSRWWDWDQGAGMPAAMALLRGTGVHCRGYWSSNRDQKQRYIQIQQIRRKTSWRWKKNNREKKKKGLPGLSPKSGVRYPWACGTKETCEGLSNEVWTSTPRPFVGPFTLRAVGTASTHIHTEHVKLINHIQHLPKVFKPFRDLQPKIWKMLWAYIFNHTE